MKLDYRFRDAGLMELALTHRSVGRPNNERLEFLGDALVNMIVAEALYETYPRFDEGKLSRLRAQLVNGDALAELARELELGDALLLGQGELKSGGFRRSSILADTFEALVAAVYLDGGFEACRNLLRTLFATRVAEAHKTGKDPKTRLQELLQAHSMNLPVYEMLGSEGEDHAKTFEVACVLQEPQAVRFAGRGSSRRSAEQDAAESALAALADLLK